MSSTQVLIGRNATVKVATASTTSYRIVAEMASFEINQTREEIDVSALGSSWAKSVAGKKKWNGSVSGFLNLSATGQDYLYKKFSSGGTIKTIRFFPGTTTQNYYYPNASTATGGVTDAAAVLTNYTFSQDQAGVARVSFSIAGSGPLKKST